MEKPSKDEVTPRKRRSGDVTSSEDRRSHASGPQVRNPKAGSTERRYKEMLHTTSHIYQTQAMSDTPEESPVSNQISHTKDTIPVRKKRSSSTGSTLPEGITTEVPLIAVMSREKPTAAVINSKLSENDSEGKANPLEKRIESSAQQMSSENGLGDRNDCFETSTCKKHSSAHVESKQKALIGRPKLCESCAVSMLSYISVLRDMLDEVTSDITNQEDQRVQCAECVKERVMQKNQIRTSTVRRSADAVSSTKDALQRPRDLPLSREYPSGAPAVEVAGNSTTRQHQQREKSVSEQQQKTQISPIEKTDSVLTDTRTAPFSKVQDFPASTVPENQTQTPELQKYSEERSRFVSDEMRPFPVQTGSTTLLDVFGEESHPHRRPAQLDASQLQRKQPGKVESFVMAHSETPTYVSKQNEASFGDALKGIDGEQDQRSSWKQNGSDHTHQVPSSSALEDFHPQISPFLRGETDGILSALSNEEREVYDSARGGAGWERLADTQDYRDTSFGPSSTEEAFVTMATTNAEAISCLVLGSSLLLCRTTRTLCVLITDGVSPSLRAPLASVFQVVQSIRSLDTVGTTKVALLDQPDLGIFFRKLHVWRLVQFSKCVFLNPETLVVQNSDELFCHEELSAVPDIGWPDCFNSGVFVFQPSVETFWKLVEFAESEGSYDGGDQGLLNAFFKDWSKDIHKKLSFIYNLMANVSYTYTPAFKQFGRNVKIVQFQGPFKPWHVKFYQGTGQIAPSTAVHPTYVQFVHVWLNIFRVRVLPLFSQDIQSFASSQNIISASEILKFYPSPVEMEADFLLTPPSVRLRLDPLGTPKQPFRRHSIGSPKELKQPTAESDDQREHLTYEEPPSAREDLTTADDDTTKDEDKSNLETEELTVDKEGPPQLAHEEQLGPAPQELESTRGEAPAESTEDDGSRRSSIPGSEIGDYHGMAAWEQGRMDYMGSACSENIIKRLHFLMDSEKPE